MTDPLLPRDGAPVEAQRELADRLNHAKEEWLDGLMSKVLPPELEYFARSQNPQEKAQAHKWLLENKIMLVDMEDCTRLVRDQQVLGELRIAFENGKCNVTAKEFV